MAAELSNLIIDALPSELKSSLLARLQPVDLPVGTVLTNPGQTPPFAHFMTSGIASVVTFMSDGIGAEVGVIGREGLVEAINLLGPASAPTTAFIQSEGTALRRRVPGVLIASTSPSAADHAELAMPSDMKVTTGSNAGGHEVRERGNLARFGERCSDGQVDWLQTSEQRRLSSDGKGIDDQIGYFGGHWRQSFATVARDFAQLARRVALKKDEFYRLLGTTICSLADEECSLPHIIAKL